MNAGRRKGMRAAAMLLLSSIAVAAPSLAAAGGVFGGRHRWVIR
jgi:hypothetical protein